MEGAGRISDRIPMVRVANRVPSRYLSRCGAVLRSQGRADGGAFFQRFFFFILISIFSGAAAVCAHDASLFRLPFYLFFDFFLALQLTAALTAAEACARETPPVLDLRVAPPDCL